MATYDYIILGNSNSSLVRRYKAIQMSNPKQRTDNMSYTLSGKTDKHAGSIINTWTYTLKVPIDDPTDANYGNYTELATLFALNNPAGTPSDVIKLTTHFGGTPLNCHFMGQMVPEPITTILEGNSGQYLIQVSLQEIK